MPVRPTTLVLLAIAAAGLTSLGCTRPIRVKNAVPQVTAVGPLSYDPATKEATIVFWVRDHEENAVDVNFDLVASNGSTTALTVHGGHGDVGVTTSNEATGRAHFVLWRTKGANDQDLDPNAPLRLRVVAIDDLGGASQAFDTREFTLTQGLPVP